MSVIDMINAQQRDDGQIIPGVFISMTYQGDKLIWLYIGTKLSGPILQYSPDPNDLYDGTKRIKTNDDDFIEGDLTLLSDSGQWDNGAWTPLYSRGNYKRNYACGGHWSSQTRNLHPSVGDQTRRDQQSECLIVGDKMQPLPKGVKGEVTTTSIDCSLGWAVWYPSARDALNARLTPDEITEANLPEITKKHLLPHEIDSTTLLRELIDLYKL